jgi:hypothetical protein
LPQEGPRYLFAYSAYLHLPDRNTSFLEIACWQDPSENQPLIVNQYGRAQAQFVWGDYFQMMGAHPLLGRTITADDDRPGAIMVVVISYRLWQQAFNGDPGIIGRTIGLNGKAFEVMGIMPKEYFGLDATTVPDATIPITTLVASDALNNDRFWGPCQLAGRLKPGVSDDQARAEIQTLVHQSILGNPPNEEFDPPRISLTNAADGADNLRRTISLPLMV